jgi:hypothetical protein
MNKYICSWGCMVEEVIQTVTAMTKCPPFSLLQL